MMDSENALKRFTKRSRTTEIAHAMDVDASVYLETKIGILALGLIVDPYQIGIYRSLSTVALRCQDAL